ncbi:MAG: MFS transporter [Nocardioidaceae bacterium]
MLDAYRTIFSTPGAKTFSATGFLARLPISMVTLGIVLLVAGQTGSYGFAGAVSAAYMVATACSSPVLARLVDKWGQHVVLVPCFLGFCVGMALLVMSIEESWLTPLPYLFAAISGACYPPVGACVRARWSKALGSTPALHTAYSLEAVVDESIFITGPVLVTFLATQVQEAAGIVAVIAVALVGGFWFASLRTTEPTPRRLGGGGDPSVAVKLGWVWLAPMVLGAVCLGALFGATEVVTVAFSQEHGHTGTAGALLAVWAAGSLIAGVITGATNRTTSPLRRYRLGAAGMACAMLPLPFVTSIPLLGVVLFVGGFAVSPTLVACMSLVEANVPSARLTEGITWVTTGIGLGVAPGAAVAGQLIDSHGASAGYLVPVAGGLLAALVASVTPGGASVKARVSEHV